MAGPIDLHMEVQKMQGIIEMEGGMATPGAIECMGEVKRLLEAGEDVNYRDSTSRTPLDYCVVGFRPSQPGIK